jgi:hypothetical protein
MMTLYCDESDDGETYALAGWLATPSAWERFELAWRAMLQTIRMPDGSACKAPAPGWANDPAGLASSPWLIQLG